MALAQMPSSASIMDTVATFDKIEDAHLFRMYLGSFGVEAFVFDEYLVQIYWLYRNAIGGVRVVVNYQDFELSSDAYHDFLNDMRRSPSLERIARVWPIVLVVTLIFGVPFMLFGWDDCYESNPDDI